MPTHRPVLAERDVTAAAVAAFACNGERTMGVEVEWFVDPVASSVGRPSARLLSSLCTAALPAAGTITLEPGGQVELSTAPHTDLDALLEALRADAAVLERRLDAASMRVRAEALDRQRRPERILATPRYVAMEAYFDQWGPSGRWMMCNTASIQVNVSNAADDAASRWHVLHRFGPVLVALFANSPGPAPTGQRWLSARQGVWATMDPGRTRPPRMDRDPVSAWAEYVLAADVMLVRAAQRFRRLPIGTPFGRWLREGLAEGWPTPDDLRYHMSTLFPPIRPRGWLELRMVDALPTRWREVPVLVAAALCHADTGALQAAPDTADLWDEAARTGLAHPRLGEAADLLIDHVRRVMPELSTDPILHETFEAFVDRFATRRRSPAHDIIDSARMGVGRTQEALGALP